MRWALRTSSRWIRALSRSITLVMSPVAGVVIDRPAIARLDQDRQAADVVVVGVRDDHRIQLAGIERQLAVGALGMDAFRIKQPAIEQDPRRADLQKVGAARDLPGRTVKRDSQPSSLPAIKRTFRRLASSPRSGPPDRTAGGSRCTGLSNFRRLEHGRVSQRRGTDIIFRLIINSIMPGTSECFKAEHALGRGRGAAGRRHLSDVSSVASLRGFQGQVGDGSLAFSRDSRVEPPVLPRRFAETLVDRSPIVGVVFARKAGDSLHLQAINPFDPHVVRVGYLICSHGPKSNG